MGMAALVKLQNADGLMLASCQVRLSPPTSAFQRFINELPPIKLELWTVGVYERA